MQRNNKNSAQPKTANEAMTRMISLLNSAFQQHVVDKIYDTQNKSYLILLNNSPEAFGEITVMKMKNGEYGFRYQNKEYSFNAMTSKLQSEIHTVYTRLNIESPESKIISTLNREFSGQHFDYIKDHHDNEILIQRNNELFIGGIQLRKDKNGQPLVDYNQQKDLALDKFIELLVRDVRVALAVNEQRTMSRGDSTNTLYTNASVLGDQQNASNRASSNTRVNDSKKNSTIYDDPSVLASSASPTNTASSSSSTSTKHALSSLGISPRQHADNVKALQPQPVAPPAKEEPQPTAQPKASRGQLTRQSHFRNPKK